MLARSLVRGYVFKCWKIVSRVSVKVVLEQNSRQESAMETCPR